NQFAPAESPQQAAQVAGVEGKLDGQFARGRVLALRELVDDAGFGQRQAAIVQALAQNPDSTGVEAAEASDGVDSALEFGIAHRPQGRTLDCFRQVFACRRQSSSPVADSGSPDRCPAGYPDRSSFAFSSALTRPGFALPREAFIT